MTELRENSGTQRDDAPPQQASTVWALVTTLMCAMDLCTAGLSVKPTA